MMWKRRTDQITVSRRRFLEYSLLEQESEAAKSNAQRGPREIHVPRTYNAPEHTSRRPPGEGSPSTPGRRAARPVPEGPQGPCPPGPGPAACGDSPSHPASPRPCSRRPLPRPAGLFVPSSAGASGRERGVPLGVGGGGGTRAEADGPLRPAGSRTHPPAVGWWDCPRSAPRPPSCRHQTLLPGSGNKGFSAAEAAATARRSLTYKSRGVSTPVPTPPFPRALPPPPPHQVVSARTRRHTREINK